MCGCACFGYGNETENNRSVENDTNNNEKPIKMPARYDKIRCVKSGAFREKGHMFTDVK